MNRQRHFVQGSFLKIVLAALILSSAGGCMFFRQPKRQDGTQQFNKFKQLDRAALDESPPLLITDYRDMKEDDTVAWVWEKPGFELGLCRSFEIAPVINTSSFKYPWAEEKVTQGLKKIFTAAAKGQGSIEAEIKCAIIDMRPRKKIVSRLLPFEEDFIYIEMQLIIIDKNTKEILCKLIHGKRTEDFKTSVDDMMKDVGRYFQKGAPQQP
jgi:hypothetical protein